MCTKTSKGGVSVLSGALPYTPGLENELVLAGRAAGKPGKGAGGSRRKTAGWRPSVLIGTTGADWSFAGSHRLLSADDADLCNYKHQVALI